MSRWFVPGQKGPKERDKRLYLGPLKYGLFQRVTQFLSRSYFCEVGQVNTTCRKAAALVVLLLLAGRLAGLHHGDERLQLLDQRIIRAFFG